MNSGDLSRANDWIAISFENTTLVFFHIVRPITHHEYFNVLM